MVQFSHLRQAEEFETLTCTIHYNKDATLMSEQVQPMKP